MAGLHEAGGLTMPRSRRAGRIVGIVSLMGSLPGGLSAQAEVPPAFRGDWVAATGDCSSASRLRVLSDRLVLIHGSDTASYGDLALPASYFGPDYAGIAVVIIPEIGSGNPPFTAFFNADERPDVARLDIWFEMPPSPIPAVQTLQDEAKKLAERFPLNQMDLTPCRK